jgi:hypothetical protein
MMGFLTPQLEERSALSKEEISKSSGVARRSQDSNIIVSSKKNTTNPLILL